MFHDKQSDFSLFFNGRICLGQRQECDIVERNSWCWVVACYLSVMYQQCFHPLQEFQCHLYTQIDTSRCCVTGHKVNGKNDFYAPTLRRHYGSDIYEQAVWIYIMSSWLRMKRGVNVFCLSHSQLRATDAQFKWIICLYLLAMFTFLEALEHSDAS